MQISRGMRIQGVYGQDVYELPVDSVREIIANSVAHRSYLEPGNIQVALFDDRLEVTSPGMLLPRNRAIASAFAYMKIIEKWGSGIPRMIRECREYNLPEPQFIDFDGDFRVNMYRQASNGVGMDSGSGKILFKQNEKATDNQESRKQPQRALGNFG